MRTGGVWIVPALLAGAMVVGTGFGGIESVVVKDPADQEQIGLIRAHLAEEARKFRQGNYEDPARIHGMEMPGLTELEAGYRRG